MKVGTTKASLYSWDTHSSLAKSQSENQNEDPNPDESMVHILATWPHFLTGKNLEKTH